MRSEQRLPTVMIGKGQLLSSTDGNGNTTAVAYDGNGNVISVTDGEGRQVRYAYDLADRLTEAMAGDASYENRNTYTYDEVGNLISTTERKWQQDDLHL